MVDKHTQDVDKQAYKYEVEISIPMHADIDALKIKTTKAGVFPENKIEVFFSSLNARGAVIIKKDITEAQADNLAKKFKAIGFRAIASPMLSLIKVEKTQKAYTCPACDAEVTLTEDRQCPACAVYVDNISKEFLLKKKIMKQEQARAKGIQHSQEQQAAQEDEAALEERLRTEIRQELERKYNLRARTGGTSMTIKRKAVYGALASLGAAALFGAGWHLSPKADTIQQAAVDTSNQKGAELNIAVQPNMRIDTVTVSDGEAVFDEEVLPQDASYAPDMQAQADLGDFSGGGVLLSKRRSQTTYANLALT